MNLNRQNACIGVQNKHVVIKVWLLNASYKFNKLGAILFPHIYVCSKTFILQIISIQHVKKKKLS